MYNFIISCYYWPAVKGQLRLRSLQIRANRRKPGNGLDNSRVAQLAHAANPSTVNERSRSRRLNVGCNVELTATLSILDSEVQSPTYSLVFLGRTKDLSASGISLLLPSTTIDERSCGESAMPLQLLLHLPGGPINLEVSPVRCEPLKNDNSALGYLIGARILSIDDNRDEYDEYLREILDQANR